MHGTAKALIVAAAALQASANPIKFFERQASSSTVSASSVSANMTTSLFEPTATFSGSVPSPTGLPPTFPFPDSNGTYYICSFPSSSNDTATSSEPSVTHTASLFSPTATLTDTGSEPTGTDDALTFVPSAAANPSISSVAATITTRPSSTPTPTPTEFTVVGPSTTAVIECIQIPTGGHSHPPPPDNVTSSFPLPTTTDAVSITSTLTSASSASIEF